MKVVNFDWLDAIIPRLTVVDENLADWVKACCLIPVSEARTHVLALVRDYATGATEQQQTQIVGELETLYKEHLATQAEGHTRH